MKFKSLVFLLCLGLFSCSKKQVTEVMSPNEKIVLNFNLDETGKPFYEVFFKNNNIIKKSSLGFDFENTASFSDDFQIVNSTTTGIKETWQMPWGEQEKL